MKLTPPYLFDLSLTANMWGHFMLKNFIKDKAGNFSAILALSLTVLIASAGMAVDLSNQMRMKTELQDSVDAATLAGAALSFEGRTDKDVREEIARRFDQSCSVENCATAMTLTTTIKPGFINV